MVDTYVDDGALYPPQLWAWEPDADEDDVPRTTNAAEAFHMHMKDLFNSPRPNLYLFAFKLLQLQEETYVNLQSLHCSRQLSSNQLERANYVFDVSQQYKYMYLSRMEYVRLMAFKHLPIDSSDRTDTDS